MPSAGKLWNSASNFSVAFFHFFHIFFLGVKFLHLFFGGGEGVNVI